MRKNGFVTPQIIYDWPLIAGEYLAKYTNPIKITYPTGKNIEGTLHIEVISAQAPLIQQLQPEIIDKISSYFGFKAVARIKLIHSNKLPPEELKIPNLPLAAAQADKLDKMLAGMEDEALKLKLKSIGEYVLRSAK